MPKGPSGQKRKAEVFPLYHVHEFECGHEDVKLIGIFSTRAKAEAALALVRDQPGFRDLPEGFSFEPTQLDRIGWTEGYVTVQPGEEF